MYGFASAGQGGGSGFRTGRQYPYAQGNGFGDGVCPTSTAAGAIASGKSSRVSVIFRHGAPNITSPVPLHPNAMMSSRIEAADLCRAAFSSWRQFELDDLLDASCAKLDRHPDEDVVRPYSPCRYTAHGRIFF